jgi:hypothetical protein
MGNNFSKPVRHNVRKQGQKPRQHGTVQSSQKLSREQLIHRLETLREKREELDLQESNDHIVKQKEKILVEYNQYLEQLKRFD